MDSDVSSNHQAHKGELKRVNQRCIVNLSTMLINNYNDDNTSNIYIALRSMSLLEVPLCVVHHTDLWYHRMVTLHGTAS